MLELLGKSSLKKEDEAKASGAKKCKIGPAPGRFVGCVSGQRKGGKAHFSLSLLLLFYQVEDNYSANYFYWEVVGGVGVIGIFGDCRA